VIRPGDGKFPALEDVEVRIGENVINAQCRRKMLVGAANAEAFLQESVFP